MVAREALCGKGVFGQGLEWGEGLGHAAFWGEDGPGRGNREYKGPAVGNTRHILGTVRARGPSVAGRCGISIGLSSDDTLPSFLPLPRTLPHPCQTPFFATRTTCFLQSTGLPILCLLSHCHMTYFFQHAPCGCLLWICFPSLIWKHYSCLRNLSKWTSKSVLFPKTHSSSGLFHLSEWHLHFSVA